MSLKDASKKMDSSKLIEIEESIILKRWKSPSIIEALYYPNVFNMILFATALFFKYRVVNKRV